MDHGSASVPAPPAVLSDLASHVSKAVTVVGKVVDASSGSTVRLEDHERATVIVNRPADSLLVLEKGMKVLVRGVVNQDLSIAEDPTFPVSDLGDNFDLKLHHDSAKVLAQVSIAIIFS
jgi:Replication factor A protein 3